jgi:4-amino-4-deoxy-L-arabinose transferase-like glycosyltransferase
MPTMKKQKPSNKPVPSPQAKGQSRLKPSTPSVESQAWDPRLVLGLHLLTLLLSLLFLRMGYFNLPLDRDESAYAYLGKRALEGGKIYQDFYEMKPPLLFYSYSLLVTLFGYSQAGLRLAAFVLSFFNAFGVYAVGRSLFKPAWALLGALVYLVLVSNPHVNGVLAQSELLVMIAVLGSAYFLFQWLKGEENPKAWRQLILAGVLMSAAVLIKQTAVFFFGFAAVILFSAHLLQNRGGNKFLGIIRDGLWFSVGVLGMLALCLLPVLLSGTFEDFKYWNFTHSLQYSNTIDDQEAKDVFNYFLGKVTGKYELTWLFGLAGGLLVLLNSRLTWAQRLGLFSFGLMAIWAITPGRRYYGHYWLQLIPAVGVLAAGTLDTLAQWTGKSNAQTGKWIAGAIGSLVLMITLSSSASIWRGNGGEAQVRDISRGNPYLETRFIADFLKTQMQTGDQLAVLGSEPQLYVYLDKKGPSRHFYPSFLSRKNEKTLAWQREALADLEKTAPKFLVFSFLPNSWSVKEDTDPILYNGAFRWMQGKYEAIGYVDYINGNTEPAELIFDASAATYKPQGQYYMMILRKKS